MSSKEKIALFKTIFPKPSTSNSNASKDNILETIIEDENNNQYTNYMETDETAPNKSTKTLLTFDQIENFPISESIEANTKL